ncbi:TetR family transcriptional regulator [Sphingomonas sp. PP-F2F-A104-K0414]|uniref:TetR/AcrR family transcriptional regulator n=1 Tax=Sphingomonas sp. PP-F2F-A104-K0414 TaxID=2135661 RepID=UPI001044C4A4|nr:TetR/AcrR family transcriptional regulator [Sphingomonas sp. PP-F2F-A104-K0414]TCP97428.1 TetR family transcriptional regulator [Sphingomonas sp. PP-F2F-A104-K0414]
MRRDAKLRRDALIAAAAESFAERGYGVPLEEIAARAGVGRGTLYRNFRDRETLALAIFEGEVDRVEKAVAHEQDLRQSLIDLVLAGTRGTALFARIAADIVADTENMAAFEALGERLARVLDPVATRARANGDVRADIDGEKLGLALRMVSGLFHDLHEGPAGQRKLEDALDLVFDGLRPR